MIADGPGDLMAQDGFQPGEPFRFSLAEKLAKALVGLQERLLNDVGGVYPNGHAALKLPIGQPAEIRTVGLQKLA
jgi:hypothetical protein